MLQSVLVVKKLRKTAREKKLKFENLEEQGTKTQNHNNRGTIEKWGREIRRWEDGQGHIGEGDEGIAGWRCKVRGKV